MDAWKRGDIAAVGRIFRLDGHGLRDDYEISGSVVVVCGSSHFKIYTPITARHASADVVFYLSICGVRTGRPQLEAICDAARTVEGVLGERMLGGGDFGASGALMLVRLQSIVSLCVFVGYDRSN